MRLEGIDYLRGLAVSFVIVYHFFDLLGLQENVLYTYAYALGQLGVPLFFIISGYLIYRSIDYNISKKGISNGLKSYTLHRLFRILPAYYINMIIVFILGLYVLHTLDTWSFHFIRNQILAHMTFTSYFIYQDTGFGINGAYWTLSIEMLWYIIAPLFFIFIKKTRYYFILFFLGFIYLGSIDLGLIDSIFHLKKDASNYLAKLFFFSFQLPGQIIYFITGIFIYKYYTKQIVTSKLILYIILATIIILFIYFSIQRYYLEYFTVRNAITLLTVTFIFILFYHRKVNEFFIVSWLGKISYSLYLWHMPILFILKKYLTPYESSWLIISSVFIVFLLSISTLSYYIVEEGGFKLRKKLEN
jgi:peptidoglycan/LPS O-acetylase OafA/YrhL